MNNSKAWPPAATPSPHTETTAMPTTPSITSEAALAGLRPTRQRTAVLRGLETADDFRSAQEWHESITGGGEAVGLTTVYRTLAALAAAGAIDCIVGADGEARYRRCSEGHHHHLVCLSCGATVEVAAPDVEAWASRTADVHGFTDISHTVEIFGRCQDCSVIDPPDSGYR